MEKVKEKNNKDDLLIIRIESKLKEEFTNINKSKKIKNSQKVRDWIEDYVTENKVYK